MYSLRVNKRTKQLVEEVADMVGLSVSSIMRKVRIKMDKGKIYPADGKEYSVVQPNGNVINYKVSEIYHNELSDWLTAEIEPISRRSINLFRSCLVAACLDTKAKSEVAFRRKQKLDNELKDYENSFVAEPEPCTPR